MEEISCFLHQKWADPNGRMMPPSTLLKALASVDGSWAKIIGDYFEGKVIFVAPTKADLTWLCEVPSSNDRAKIKHLFFGGKGFTVTMAEKIGTYLGQCPNLLRLDVSNIEGYGREERFPIYLGSKLSQALTLAHSLQTLNLIIEIDVLEIPDLLRAIGSLENLRDIGIFLHIPINRGRMPLQRTLSVQLLPFAKFILIDVCTSFNYPMVKHIAKSWHMPALEALRMHGPDHQMMDISPEEAPAIPEVQTFTRSNGGLHRFVPNPFTKSQRLKMGTKGIAGLLYYEYPQLESLTFEGELEILDHSYLFGAGVMELLQSLFEYIESTGNLIRYDPRMLQEVPWTCFLLLFVWAFVKTTKNPKTLLISIEHIRFEDLRTRSTYVDYFGHLVRLCSETGKAKNVIIKDSSQRVLGASANAKRNIP